MSQNREYIGPPNPVVVKAAEEEAKQRLKQHNPPLELDTKYSGLFDATTEKALREHNGNIPETVADISSHIIDDYENAKKSKKAAPYYLHPTK